MGLWAALLLALLIVVGIMTGRLPIGRHFTWAELTTTSTGLPNVPDPADVIRATVLAVRVLDPLRDAVGPVHVTSWYRSRAVNEAVGGVSTSHHLRGEAADVYVPGYTSSELADVVDALDLPYTELGVYPDSSSGRIHVAYAVGRDERQRYTGSG